MIIFRIFGACIGMIMKKRALPVVLVLASLICAGNISLETAAYSATPNIYAYITNFDSNTVSVIDVSSNTVIETVSVGINPIGVATSPDGSKVFVTNNNSNTVSEIDTISNTVSATIGVGDNPYGAAVSPDGNTLYVANYSSHTLSVIDVLTNAVTANISVIWYTGYVM